MCHNVIGVHYLIWEMPDSSRTIVTQHRGNPELSCACSSYFSMHTLVGITSPAHQSAIFRYCARFCMSCLVIFVKIKCKKQRLCVKWYFLIGTTSLLHLWVYQYSWNFQHQSKTCNYKHEFWSHMVNSDQYRYIIYNTRSVQLLTDDMLTVPTSMFNKYVAFAHAIFALQLQWHCAGEHKNLNNAAARSEVYRKALHLGQLAVNFCGLSLSRTAFWFKSTLTEACWYGMT